VSTITQDERIDQRIKAMLGGMTSREELLDLVRSGSLKPVALDKVDEAPYEAIAPTSMP